MPRPLSEAPPLHFERARDCEGSSKTAWYIDYIFAGEVPGQGVVVEGVKGVKYAPKPPWMYKNGRFLALIDFKTAKNAIFYLNILNKLYFWDIFEEYNNLKIVGYFRWC